MKLFPGAICKGFCALPEPRLQPGAAGAGRKKSWSLSPCFNPLDYVLGEI